MYIHRAIANHFTLIHDKRNESNVMRKGDVNKKKNIRTISPYLVNTFFQRAHGSAALGAGEIIIKGKFIVPTSFSVNSLRFYRAFLGQ